MTDERGSSRSEGHIIWNRAIVVGSQTTCIDRDRTGARGGVVILKGQTTSVKHIGDVACWAAENHGVAANLAEGEATAVDAATGTADTVAPDIEAAVVATNFGIAREDEVLDTRILVNLTTRVGHRTEVADAIAAIADDCPSGIRCIANALAVQVNPGSGCHGDS